MKFKTLFMIEEENTAIILIWHSFFNMSKQLLAPWGSNAECVQVSVM